jgi:hypothetical protein
MTLLTNEDFADCELSLEELDAIAAAGFWSTFERVAGAVIKYGTIGGLLFTLGFLGYVGHAAGPDINNARFTT